MIIQSAKIFRRKKKKKENEPKRGSCDEERKGHLSIRQKERTRHRNEGTEGAGIVNQYTHIPVLSSIDKLSSPSLALPLIDYR